MSSELEDEQREGKDETADGAEKGGENISTKLPCRLNISLNGIEWFVYNRSGAYDAIVAGMTRSDDEHYETVLKSQMENYVTETNLRKRGGNVSYPKKGQVSSESPSLDLKKRGSEKTEKSTSSTRTGDARSRELSITQTQQSSGNGEQRGNPGKALILRFLPLHVDCHKAAVVLGNENTKSVLITKVERASGEINATRSNDLDQYRQLIDFQFEHPIIQLKPNDDYKEDQTAAASKSKRGVADQPDSKGRHVHNHSFWHRHRRKAWHKLQDLVPAFRSSVESMSSSLGRPETAGQSGPNNWQGLSRYLDENEQDDKARWSSIEYATVSTIADSPKASMSFYWDVVGIVPARPRTSKSSPVKETSNINGDLPPDWGIDLFFKGATINYGPWADRQRAEIQKVFFPSLCKDASASEKLVPGQFRTPTEFKLYIEFDDETTLRVPIREESKNWKWTKQADNFSTHPRDQKRNGNKSRKRKAEKGSTGPEIRPFGWLDIKVGSNATVRYAMDMVAGPSGFSSKLELDLPQIEITTSVNHGLLWRSVENKVSCDLSTPLQWNGHRSWKFDVNSDGLELFILREHTFLLIDLVDDWASGPPPEYLTFTPFRYLVNLQLSNFRLYLNVNDSNIINNPSDFDDNTFIIIFGSTLNADICIPIDRYRPHRNDILFNVEVRDAGLNLHVPPWNTQATFLSSTELATLKLLAIDGSYEYCATTSTSNTDTLFLDIHGNAPSARFYGFVIRYFLKIKDNYFGDDIRFKTLEEYQDVLRARREGTEIADIVPPHKKSNDLDVILGVTADEASVILPSNLYSAKSHTRIELATLAADLRFTNYYMDLEAVINTLAFSADGEDNGMATPISATSSTQLFIDGISATGNRLFGLPPTEPTYVCNWDFGVGAITGECTTDFFNRLIGGARAFAFSYDDDENVLPAIVAEVLHDVTFLRATIESMRLWLHVEDAAFLLSAGTISLNFNDWAGSHYSKKLNLGIPGLNLACVDAESASRHRSRTTHPVETNAIIKTDLSFAIIDRKLGFAEDRQLQQEHVKRHDQRTHRADFLLHQHLLGNSMLVPIDAPAMGVPPMPAPVRQGKPLDPEVGSTATKRTSLLHQRRKASFLSVSSSGHRSAAGIIHPQSSPEANDPSPPELRSRSLQVGGHEYGISRRDASASTGRQSSFYSAVGENRGLPPSSVTFSSSYIAPYFPLEGVDPDPKDLPAVSLDLEDESSFRARQLRLDDIHPDRVAENATHLSFILEFANGISGFFDAKAINALASLLSAMQAVDPVDILDELQVASMNEIFALNKQKIATGKILDLAVRTPGISIRFLNCSSLKGLNSYDHDMHDQYDLSISGLAITSRSEVVPMESETPEDDRTSSTFHLLLGSAGLAAKERLSDMSDPQAAVHGVLEDVVFWLASTRETSATIAFKVVELTTVSSKLEYLASLLHRTKMLGIMVTETFSIRLKQQQNRVQLFTYLIATAGQQAPDPLFLTRPSYVLRSASNHLRSSDSWKIITRLHHMYASLDLSTQADIKDRCFNNSEAVPKDAHRRVREGFNQWRSWDLNDLSSCLVMRKIFGSREAIVATTTPKPMKLSCRTEHVRLILDPGPKQNEVLLELMTVTFEQKATIPQLDENPEDDPQTSRSIILQIFCSDVTINLNWELCELAYDIMKLYDQSGPYFKKQDNLTLETSAQNVPKLGYYLHLIIATENGTSNLDAINIKVTSVSNGLKASFVMRDRIGARSQPQASLVLGAEAATSMVKSHTDELTLYQLRHPSIHASYESLIVAGMSTNATKVAGNCQELSMAVKQDIQTLIAVLDLVIGDELAQIYRLKNTVSAPRSRKAPVKQSASAPESRNRLDIALFLDMYDISIPLLQSLKYNISGVIARGSVAAQLESEIIFDFDIKEHAHDVQTMTNNKIHSISLLQMPPTNGRITTNLSDEETSVAVHASIETIELDAAAIHSLLTTLNMPEISTIVFEMKEDIKGIQAHLEETLGPAKIASVTKTPTERKPFIYDAHLTMAGFDVFANARGTHSEHDSARLDLNLGCLQLVFSNRLESRGPVLAFPELLMSLRQIMFELSRWNGSAMEPCGNLAFVAFLTASSKQNASGEEVRSFHMKSDTLESNIFAETASSIIDVVGHLQDKIKDLDLLREKNYFRKLRKPKPLITVNEEQLEPAENTSSSAVIFASMYSLELLNIQMCWHVEKFDPNRSLDRERLERENLILSLKRIDLSTMKENTARLTIEDLQLQMVPVSQDKTHRSLNSALLPEVIFNVGYVSTTDTHRLAFQSAGKSLDLRLTSQFMIPAADLQKSIASAADRVRTATASWTTSMPSSSPAQPSRRQPFFGKKRMESLLVDADFAGAVVYLSAKTLSDNPRSRSGRAPQAGRYGQFTHTDASSNTVLRAPGLAWKIEYKDSGLDDPSLNAEVKVDASSNILYPAVVPLILEISSTVKEVVSEEDKKPPESKPPQQKFMSADEDNILTADPSAVLGRTRLNLGVRICRQEFSLSCQPIARVAATARFDHIYLTINTLRSTEHGHFFAASAAITRLKASVQHVYSRESTGSFDVDSVFLSLMNSKHVRGTSGVSTILKISPMRVLVNAKQLQDFLLFREIWVPIEIRQSSSAPVPTPSREQSQTFLVQRYQQVAATGAFPWNATVSIAELDVQLDLGQAIGKSSFRISKFWVSSKKNSDWEQNLCLGFEKVGVDSSGRMSGFVTLQDFRVRTSIEWPAREMALNQTPLVQGSLVFSQFRVKAAFDYQAFLVADITSFEFLMYNVRNGPKAKGDRLVAILDGEAIQVFCTTTSASQALALFQAFQRLVQEKRSNYEASLSELERFMKRKSVAQPSSSPRKNALESTDEERLAKSPISLHTDVIVTLKAVNTGCFPNIFSDHQVFKIEALNAQARFAVTMDAGKIHSILGLTLGQLRIGLAGVKKNEVPRSVGDISVEDVVNSATGSRGGTILRVPKVEAIMQTWQVPGSNHIDYIFESSFEGKVEVGWNYSRISYLRSMWASHSKALAQRLGKPLPPSAVKITGVPDAEDAERKDGEQQKITAEVNVPQSKYDYTALEPPIIETPQLRDMGEATPPLEWIGKPLLSSSISSVANFHQACIEIASRTSRIRLSL